MTVTEDVRVRIADDIVRNLISGTIIKIYKTPRAGATTSLILSLFKENKKVLVCEPTNKIINETIIQNIPKHCKNKNPVIIPIPANSECIINQKKIENNKHLAKLPYMRLPSECGENCEYYKQCPVTRILREECDVIAITYDKLSYLMLSSFVFGKGISVDILAKIKDSIDSVLFDECHDLMYDRTSSLEIIHKYNSKYRNNLMKKLNKLGNIKSGQTDFRPLKCLLVNYACIAVSSDVKTSESKLQGILRTKNPPSLYRHQAECIENPYPNGAICYSIRPKSEKEANSKEFDSNGRFQGILTIYRIQEGYAALYDQITQLTDYVGQSDIEIDDVIALCHALNIVISHNLTVHCQRKLYRETINGKRDETWVDETAICAVDKNKIMMLKRFVTTMQQNCGIVATSATICESEYSQLSNHGTPIKEFLFGENGDPLKTNSKMTIFADSYSFSAYGDNTVYNHREELKQLSLDVMTIFGQDECILICANKDDSKLFKKIFEGTGYNPQITYYRSGDVMGVESNKRIAILIGLAHKPSHGYDAIRDTAEESQTLKEESMHADVTQAASRVKDPNGTEPSILFAFGCRKHDLDNAFKWGIGRTVEIPPLTDKLRRKEIEVIINGEEISSPNIMFSNDWTETLIQSILCKYSLYSKPRKVPYISDNNGTFEAYQYKVNSKCSLLDAFFKNKDVDTSIRSIDGEFKAAESLTEELLSKHTNGKANIYFHALQPDNIINFAMFESWDERAIHRLKIYLDSKEIPYVIEKLVPPVKLGLNPALIRVWVMLEDTPAENASKFAKNLVMETGFKVKGADKEIEFYPKQTKQNSRSKGDFIQMPFGKNSLILVDGEFVDDFEEMDFGHLKIAQ